jgi:predicted transcriptional regulator
MKTSKMKEIEQEHGKSLRTVLLELFERHGNQRDVAKELGVSQGTISMWLIRCGLEVRSVLVQREVEAL